MTTTTTTARQLVRIVGAVAGAGLAVQLWPDGGDGGEGGASIDTKNRSNGSNRSRHVQYPRLRLLQHSDVRLVPEQQQQQQQQQQRHGEAAMKALPPPPAWLMHHFGQKQGKEDEKDDRQQHQEEQQQQQQDQHPLVFISCLDPFVMENLVQDVLELRSQGQGSPGQIIVDFIAHGDSPEGQQVLVNSQQQQPLSSALATLNNNTSSTDNNEKKPVVVLHLGPLLSLPTATPTTNEALRQVVEWLLETHEKKDAPQVVLTASTSLALWRLQDFILKQQQKQEEKEKVVPLPIFHFAVLGPNQALREHVLSSLRPTPVPVPAIEEKEEGGNDDASVVETSGQDDEIAINKQEEDDESEKQETTITTKSSLQQEFWSLRPSLATIATLAEDDGSLESLLTSKEDKLRTALESKNEAAVLLWDVLHAVHGERVDLLSQSRISAGQDGVVPLEVLLGLCENDFRKVEGLMMEGWVEPFYPEVNIDKVEVVRELVEEGGEEEREEENGSAVTATHTKAKPSTQIQKPLLVCRGSMKMLGGEQPSPQEEQGEPNPPIIPQHALPTMMTTPATVTLAWKALEVDPDLALLMNARADARHFVQQALLLQQHRMALAAEWQTLHTGRVALRERRHELTTEDFVGLQLELMRLERSAASRALEMSLRHKRLRELHGQLKEILKEGEDYLPGVGLLEIGASGGLVAGGGEAAGGSMMVVPVEEVVLAEMDRGLRGVPVEDLSSSSTSSSSLSSSSAASASQVQEQQQQGEEGKKETKRRWWWPFGGRKQQ